MPKATCEATNQIQSIRAFSAGLMNFKVDQMSAAHRTTGSQRRSNGCTLDDLGDGTVRVKRQTEYGYDVIEAPLPAVIAVSDAINEPRYPSLKGIMGAKKKPQETLSLGDVGVAAEEAGEAGSRTTVEALNDPPARGDTVKLEDDGTAAEKIAALAQFGAFRGASYAEPVGAGLREGARDGNDSVSVGVALDDGENFPARAARAGGIYMLPDRTQIVRQRSQAYFRPDRASIKFYRSCHWNLQE